MRLSLLLVLLLPASSALAQPGEAQRAVNAVAGCCGSGMCAANGDGGGCCSMGCCAMMRREEGDAGAHEGHQGHETGEAGMSGCCAMMRGGVGEAGAQGHEGHGAGEAAMSCCCAGMHGEAGEHGQHGMMHGHAPAYGAAETPAHEAVRTTINTLFDAMRAGDGDALLATFHEGATLTSVGAGRDGVLGARREGIEGFAEAVSAPHPEPYDERIGPIEVRVDGPLATAWMTYRFHVGETFSHCGVNSFQLADTGDGWKILAVTDTRRQECDSGE